MENMENLRYYKRDNIRSLFHATYQSPAFLVSKVD